MWFFSCLQISNPDEFDVMVAIPVDRVDVSPFGDDGAFYSVELKRGNSPLKRFEESSTLSASKMLDEFRAEVKECAKKYTGNCQNVDIKTSKREIVRKKSVYDQNAT